ncbi:MAG: SIS domain-containing protein [Gemmatimonadota bacterium]|nr:SIS domain-containing protein [Gemmatimonadota bacterium]
MSPSPESLEAWRERERSLDPRGMRAHVANLPKQIAEAVGPARAFATGIAAAAEPPSAIAVVGMGGSAIGGDLVAACTRDRRARPLLTVRGYDLPGWLDESALVVASSYSGNTEETLATYDAAKARGLAAVAVTTGGSLGERARAAGDPILELPAGFPPRAALGWSFTACALIVARLDPGLEVEAEAERIDAAAQWLEDAGAGWLEWDAANPVLDAAADAARGIAIVHGGHPVAVASAYRWKSQLNENAKRPAWHAALPEHNHTEIVGWEADEGSLEGLVGVFLETPWDHPRVRRRFDHVRRRIESAGVPTHRFVAAGENPLEGMLWLCWLGDCASFLASVIAGRDPSPVQSIDTLKAELGGDG